MARLLPLLLLALGTGMLVRRRRANRGKPGLVPKERLNTHRPAPAPELDRIMAAAKNGDWRPGAAFLLATGKNWERRTSAVGNLASVAAQDDSWLRAWESARPGDPDAAVVRADATIKLAWALRGGARAGQTTTEQFDGFFHVLARADKDTMRAQALNPEDPTPYASEMWTAMGLGRPHEEIWRLLSSVTCRAPYHYAAHYSALQYWCAKRQGSRELALGFAEQTAAGAPRGSLLSVLRLLAWWEHRAEDVTAADFRTPDLLAATDAVLADVAAAPPSHPHLAAVRHVLAYFLVRQGRGAAALEQFQAVDGYAGAFPWTRAADPAGLYLCFRDLAVQAGSPSGGGQV
jgi:hypothetical protein